jgi:hypothetical protein
MAARTDMDRIGLFSEMGYLLGDKYKTPSKGSFNEAASKGKQMLGGHSKSKAATKDGYFAEFGRVFDKEAYSDFVKMRRRDRMESNKRNIGKSWVPSSYPAKAPGPGTHHGTIGGRVDHFIPNERKDKAYSAPPKNLYTNPGKLGTGYGYGDVTIGKLPNYQSEPLSRADDQYRKEASISKKQMKAGAFRLNMAPKEFFDENPYKTDKPLPPARKSAPARESLKPFRPSNPGKDSGGGKFGTFDPYPDHPKDPYPNYNPNVFRQQKPGEKVFIPAPGPKSYVVNSVVDQMVEKNINSTNYNYVESCY